MKTVLYLSYTGMTDPLGQAQVLPYLCQLSEHGYNITILSVEKKDQLEKTGATIQKLITENKLNWHPLIFHKALPLFSKMYDRYLLKKAAHKLYQKVHYDIVHCRSYVAAEVGLSLKKKFGVKFIFDMRGFWADEKKDSGHWNVTNPIYNRIYGYYKKLERKLLLTSDAVVVLTNAAKAEIATWNLTPTVLQKIHVIPCCADLVHFSSNKINSALRSRLIDELGLADAFPVLCYLGSIGESYAINEMLYFFNEVKKNYSRAKFLFFTKDDPALVESRLHNYPDVAASDVIVRFIQRKDIPTYLSLCTFSVFFYVPTYSRIACSPTKFAEISGLGIPVVCNTVGDLNQSYLQGLPHLVIDNLSDKAIQDSVSLIETFRTADKNAIRAFALEEYNLEDGVMRYRSIYQMLTM